MLDYAVTIEDFKKMIQEPHFRMKDYDYVDFKSFEQITTYGYGLATLFEDMAGELGRIPTQNEYIEKGLTISRAFFLDPKKVKDGGRWLTVGKLPNGKNDWFHFKWNKLLEKAVKSRLARGYPSFVVEYSTILTILSEFPEYYVGVNDYLDGIAGIDFVIGSKKHNKVLYVHITNGSNYSEYWLEKKENRTGKGWDGEGNKYEYKRSFKKGHLHLKFTHYYGESTDFINNIPLIRKSHLQEVLEMAFKHSKHIDSFKEMEQLALLDDWLVTNGIDEKGLGFKWLNQQLIQ